MAKQDVEMAMKYSLIFSQKMPEFCLTVINPIQGWLWSLVLICSDFRILFIFLGKDYHLIQVV